MEAARTAGPGDVDRLVVLADEARREVSSLRGGELLIARSAHARADAAGWRAWLDDRDRQVVVGTIDDVVVGFGALCLVPLDDGSVLGVVAGLYVEPPARGVGVGEAILGSLLEICDGHGCRGLDVDALPGQRSTKNFLEGQGFKARLLVMHRACGDQP